MRVQEVGYKTLHSDACAATALFMFASCIYSHSSGLLSLSSAMQICEKGAGSALLQKPKRFENVVRAAVRTARRCGITFKTRTAYTKQLCAHTILPQAAAWGACAVTLHGRTREQRYSKSADWNYIGRIAQDMPEEVQMIGNGDVLSFEDYEAHMADGKVRRAACVITHRQEQSQQARPAIHTTTAACVRVRGSRRCVLWPARHAVPGHCLDCIRQVRLR